MNLVNGGIVNRELPADKVAALTALRQRVERGELEGMDAAGLEQFERELDNARAPFPLPFDHPHAQGIAYCWDALKSERNRRHTQEMMRSLETQRRFDTVRGFIDYAARTAAQLASILDAHGVTTFAASPTPPAKVSAKAAASMTDDELKAALSEARAVVLDQHRVQLPTQAESMHELARVSVAVADHLDKLAKEHEACHGIATRNAATIEKELASRADERARQEAARAELEANLPEVVAELQRQIDELRGSSNGTEPAQDEQQQA